jgi:hypothetical protein
MQRMHKKKKKKPPVPPVPPPVTEHVVHWTVKYCDGIQLEMWVPNKASDLYYFTVSGLKSLGRSYSDKYDLYFAGYSVPIVKWAKVNNIFYLWSDSRAYSADFSHRFDGKDEQSLRAIMSILKSLPKTTEIPTLPTANLPTTLPVRR